MNKDPEIEKLFKCFNPEIQQERFMMELQEKMDVVDKVEAEHRQIIHFHQMVSISCLVIGLVIGAGLMYISLFHPIDWMILPETASWISIPPYFSPFFSSDIILSLLAAFLIIIGALPMIYLESWGKYSKP